jgi:hypothetical protein
MGAVKEMAIELEANMAEAAEFAARYESPSLAYRFGMLEACRLIAEAQGRHASAEAFDALGRAWNEVYEAVLYLRESEQNSD